MRTARQESSVLLEVSTRYGLLTAVRETIGSWLGGYCPVGRCNLDRTCAVATPLMANRS